MPECAKAFFLVGPTAVGKTVVGQHLAEQTGADILSADAMLVYRGIDIGTAKPSREEQARVSYWGLDLVAPGEPFSVARFLDVARDAVAACRARGRPLIVVGGTGLYVKALLQGLEKLPLTSEHARAHWQGVFREQGVSALQDALRTRAPAWLEAMSDPANGRRLIRALELVEAGLTAPPDSWRQDSVPPEIAGLSLERSLLEERIRSRVAAMYAAGLLKEVAALQERQAFAQWSTAAQAVGYAEAAACLAGGLSEADARERTVIRTRQLAKRQMTWFRHQCRVHWVEWSHGAGVAEVARQVKAVWDTIGPASLAV